ncbi:unnamed protein product [Nippostrongylus brasiliensis]|uniref:PINc domain-containing protein n=1 Tax=Nippostrongylus brasiliensis TaxID=27835 RepID=A0A0N4YK56_NIPBR|nr:unnamed protein product [Nippostrongylus brasiliensis]
MEIDFSEDLRQMRGVHYDREELTQGENEAQTFSPDGSSRCCVVIDTCAVIEDPELIDCCLDREVILAVPYRVFYELDNMRKITSTSTSTVQLQSYSHSSHVPKLDVVTVRVLGKFLTGEY